MTGQAMEVQDAVEALVDAGVMVDPGAVDRLTPDLVERIRALSPTPMVVNDALLDNLEGGEVGVETSVRIETEIEMEKEKRDIQDFVDFYNDRYERIKALLLRRRDIRNAVSISRLDDMEERDDVSVVGIVNEKYRSSSGKFIVYIEDPTGQTKILVDEDDGEHIVQDEVIGANGSLGDDIVFADDVIWPDVPLPSGEVNATDEEVFAAFISDIHFGSIDTLNETLDQFADWLHGGDEEAQKTRYLFVVGDAVEGVGNYPGQEEELEVTNVYDQYERFEAFVEQLPDGIEVIVIPGNHDMVRLAEPQPPLPEDVVPRLHEMDNVHLAPNPSYVTVHGHDGGGISVLLYHGYSFDGHVDALPHLRDKAYEDPEHAMIDWLKRRHVAPIYGSNLMVPDDEDPMVIDEVPDIFAIGHSHSFACTTYKGVNLVSAGTFQGQTDFQKRVGHKPDPGKVALINLHTREATVKQFVNGETDG